MANLATLKQYANKCADKLGLPAPVLRWSGEPCKVKSHYHAHCHTKDGEFPRGTICLNKHWFLYASVKQWHHCIAHEVCHLSVKSPHGSPTFDRRLVALGVANYFERLNARSAKKGHHHRYYFCTGYPDGRTRQCRICGKHNGIGGGLARQTISR